MTISPQQFPEQLKMFMSPNEIIDTTTKSDSGIVGPGATPRDQWERRDSGSDRRQPLRDEKLQGLDRSWRRRSFSQSYSTMPPVDITYTHPVSPDRPMLTQGHHRLAWAEENKVSFLAVNHQGLTEFMRKRLSGR